MSNEAEKNGSGTEGFTPRARFHCFRKSARRRREENPSVISKTFLTASAASHLSGQCRLVQLFTVLCSIKCIPIAARDGSNPAPDFFLYLVRQVGQRDTQRPVWRLKAAAVQQHDPVVLSQAESEIERMDVLLQVLNRFCAYVLAGKELEVDQAVVGVIERVRWQFKAQSFKQGRNAPVNDLP